MIIDYTYIIIFFLIIIFFIKFTVTLNILFGTFVACGVIYYLWSNKQKKIKEHEEIINNKKSLIYPTINESINKIEDDELVNILYAIQDFYMYNPNAYEEMIHNVNYFFMLFNECINNNQLAGTHYDVLKNTQQNIMNSLNSILYNMPPNSDNDKKLSDAIIELKNITNKYIKYVIKLNSEYIYNNGYNVHTVHIYEDMPLAHNSIKSSYDFFV